MEKVKTSIYLDGDTYEKLKEVATNDDRSINGLIVKIIKEYLKDK
jgi:hypothetical protein